MAVQRHIWVNYIIAALFAKNTFLQNALNWDEFVAEGKTVHVPQAGDPSDIVLNANSFPIDATERTDDEIQFNLDTLYVKPVRIPKIDEYELSYNKRESVMGLNLKALADLLGLIVLFRWASAYGTDTNNNAIGAAPVIRTTGASTAATFIRRIGKNIVRAAGMRKGMTKEDLIAAQLFFDNQDIPEEGRFGCIPAGMLANVLKDSDLIKRDNAMEIDPKTGAVTKLYGFQLIKRSRSLAYDNASTPVVQNPITVNTMNQTSINTLNNGAFFWSQYSVGKAQGPTEVFEDERNPNHYGTILSFLQKFGACKGRLDLAGTLSIVEEVAA